MGNTCSTCFRGGSHKRQEEEEEQRLQKKGKRSRKTPFKISEEASVTPGQISETLCSNVLDNDLDNPNLPLEVSQPEVAPDQAALLEADPLPTQVKPDAKAPAVVSDSVHVNATSAVDNSLFLHQQEVAAKYVSQLLANATKIVSSEYVDEMTDKGDSLARQTEKEDSLLESHSSQSEVVPAALLEAASAADDSLFLHQQEVAARFVSQLLADATKIVSSEYVDEMTDKGDSLARETEKEDSLLESHSSQSEVVPAALLEAASAADDSLFLHQQEVAARFVSQLLADATKIVSSEYVDEMTDKGDSLARETDKGDSFLESHLPQPEVVPAALLEAASAEDDNLFLHQQEVAARFVSQLLADATKIVATDKRDSFPQSHVPAQVISVHVNGPSVVDMSTFHQQQEVAARSVSKLLTDATEIVASNLAQDNEKEERMVCQAESQAFPIKDLETQDKSVLRQTETEPSATDSQVAATLLESQAAEVEENVKDKILSQEDANTTITAKKLVDRLVQNPSAEDVVNDAPRGFSLVADTDAHLESDEHQALLNKLHMENGGIPIEKFYKGVIFMEEPKTLGLSVQIPEHNIAGLLALPDDPCSALYSSPQYERPGSADRMTPKSDGSDAWFTGEEDLYDSEEEVEKQPVSQSLMEMIVPEQDQGSFELPVDILIYSEREWREQTNKNIVIGKVNDLENPNLPLEVSQPEVVTAALLEAASAEDDSLFLHQQEVAARFVSQLLADATKIVATDKRDSFPQSHVPAQVISVYVNGPSVVDMSTFHQQQEVAARSVSKLLTDATEIVASNLAQDNEKEERMVCQAESQAFPIKDLETQDKSVLRQTETEPSATDSQVAATLLESQAAEVEENVKDKILSQEDANTTITAKKLVDRLVQNPSAEDVVNDAPRGFSLVADTDAHLESDEHQALLNKLHMENGGIPIEKFYKGVIFMEEPKTLGLSVQIPEHNIAGLLALPDDPCSALYSSPQYERPGSADRMTPKSDGSDAWFTGEEDLYDSEEEVEKQPVSQSLMEMIVPEQDQGSFELPVDILIYSEREWREQTNKNIVIGKVNDLENPNLPLEVSQPEVVTAALLEAASAEDDSLFLHQQEVAARFVSQLLADATKIVATDKRDSFPQSHVPAQVISVYVNGPSVVDMSTFHQQQEVAARSVSKLLTDATEIVASNLAQDNEKEERMVCQAESQAFPIKDLETQDKSVLRQTETEPSATDSQVAATLLESQAAEVEENVKDKILSQEDANTTITAKKLVDRLVQNPSAEDVVNDAPRGFSLVADTDAHLESDEHQALLNKLHMENGGIPIEKFYKGVIFMEEPKTLGLSVQIPEHNIAGLLALPDDPCSALYSSPQYERPGSADRMTPKSDGSDAWFTGEEDLYDSEEEVEKQPVSQSLMEMIVPEQDQGSFELPVDILIYSEREWREQTNKNIVIGKVNDLENPNLPLEVSQPEVVTAALLEAASAEDDSLFLHQQEVAARFVSQLLADATKIVATDKRDSFPQSHVPAQVISVHVNGPSVVDMSTFHQQQEVAARSVSKLLTTATEIVASNLAQDNEKEERMVCQAESQAFPIKDLETQDKSVLRQTETEPSATDSQVAATLLESQAAEVEENVKDKILSQEDANTTITAKKLVDRLVQNPSAEDVVNDAPRGFSLVADTDAHLESDEHQALLNKLHMENGGIPIEKFYKGVIFMEEPKTLGLSVQIPEHNIAGLLALPDDPCSALYSSPQYERPGSADRMTPKSDGSDAWFTGEEDLYDSEEEVEKQPVSQSLMEMIVPEQDQGSFELPVDILIYSEREWREQTNKNIVIGKVNDLENPNLPLEVSQPEVVTAALLEAASAEDDSLFLHQQEVAARFVSQLLADATKIVATDKRDSFPQSHVPAQVISVHVNGPSVVDMSTFHQQQEVAARSVSKLLTTATEIVASNLAQDNEKEERMVCQAESQAFPIKDLETQDKSVLRQTETEPSATDSQVAATLLESQAAEVEENVKDKILSQEDANTTITAKKLVDRLVQNPSAEDVVNDAPRGFSLVADTDAHLESDEHQALLNKLHMENGGIPIEKFYKGVIFMEEPKTLGLSVQIPEHNIAGLLALPDDPCSALYSSPQYERPGSADRMTPKSDGSDAWFTGEEDLYDSEEEVEKQPVSQSLMEMIVPEQDQGSFELPVDILIYSEREWREQTNKNIVIGKVNDLENPNLPLEVSQPEVVTAALLEAASAEDDSLFLHQQEVAARFVSQLLAEATKIVATDKRDSFPQSHVPAQVISVHVNGPSVVDMSTFHQQQEVAARSVSKLLTDATEIVASNLAQDNEKEERMVCQAESQAFPIKDLETQDKSVLRQTETEPSATDSQVAATLLESQAAEVEENVKDKILSQEDANTTITAKKLVDRLVQNPSAEDVVNDAPRGFSLVADTDAHLESHEHQALLNKLHMENGGIPIEKFYKGVMFMEERKSLGLSVQIQEHNIAGLLALPDDPYSALYSSPQYERPGSADRMTPKSDGSDAWFTGEEDLYDSEEEVENQPVSQSLMEMTEQDQGSFELPVDILIYSEREWREQTNKNIVIRKGYTLLSQTFRCLQQVREDNYSALRASLYQALMSTRQPPDWLLEDTFLLIPEELEFCYGLIKDWPFPDICKQMFWIKNAVDRMKHYLGLLQKWWCAAAASFGLEGRRRVCEQLFQGGEEEFAVMEALKLLMLARAVEFYTAMQQGDDVPILFWLLFARGTASCPRTFLANHLSQVGFSGGVEQMEMFILGYALQCTIKVYRLHRANTEEFIAYYPADHLQDWPSVCLVTKDDHYYNVPVDHLTHPLWRTSMIGQPAFLQQLNCRPK